MRTRLLFSVLFFFFSLTALSYAQTAVGDLNGDGKPDVVVGNGSSNTVTIFMNDGAGNLTAVRFLPAAHTVQSVLLADFNQDGHLDILVHELPATLELFSGDGTGNFSAGVQLPIGTQTLSTDPVVADFNGDGFQDIAFASGEAIAILFGDGHGGFLPPRLFTIGLEGATFGHLYVTDANLDGKPDLLAVGGNVRLGGAPVCYIALNNIPAGF
ncbi:MAG TPA: VCBS repeat-containing protein, partial [Candidatus Angelobacter sp.]